MLLQDMTPKFLLEAGEEERARHLTFIGIYFSDIMLHQK